MTIHFFIVENLGYDAILGIDFLEKNNAEVSFADMTLTLPGSMPVKLSNRVNIAGLNYVICPETITVPAESQSLIQGKLMQEINKAETRVVEGTLDLFNRHSLSAGRALAHVTDGTVPLMLFNPLPTTVVIIMV